MRILKYEIIKFIKDFKKYNNKPIPRVFLTLIIFINIEAILLIK